MGSFAKVYRKLWDGTLATSWEAWSVFVFMLAHANARGEIDMTAGAIARRSGIPEDAVLRALAVLSAPDPDSRTEAEGGRRIVLLDAHRAWGWRIVNHATYRELRDPVDRREQNRRAAQRRREKLRAAGAVPAVIWGHAGRQQASAGVSKRQQASADRQQASAGVSRRQRDAEDGGAKPSGTPTSDAVASASVSQSQPESAQAEAEAEKKKSVCAELQGSTAPTPSRMLEAVTQGELVAARVAAADGASRTTWEADRAGPEMELPVVGVKLGGVVPIWRPLKREVELWRSAYPGVDVTREFARMRAWLVANPRKRKTWRGVAAFVNRWLSTEQDKVRSVVPQTPEAQRSRERANAELQRRLSSYRENAVPPPKGLVESVTAQLDGGSSGKG